MPEEPVGSQEAHGSYIAQAMGGGTATVNVYASPPSLADQNRQRFLVRLRTRYRELLEQSLRSAVRMTLELAGYPEAVTPPVRLLYEPDQQPAQPLPVGTSLTKVYEDAGHELLVLGEPGAGKSMLLLELAFELVKQAEQDHHLLLPVIVPLSSWASQRQPLEQWLTGQIALLYDIALPLAHSWVHEERLLPLLDGLDEMEEQARVDCIAAINTYHRAHLHPLVVCSRQAEYEVAATHERLALHNAVIVQPLTEEQVDAYLEQGGEPVAELRTALRENPVLQEIATTPLMLSILMLTYQGKAMNDLPTTDSLPEQQRQIFTTYVVRMVARKGGQAHFPIIESISRLAWLARQMRQRNQTIFYLEHLQPDWLTSAQQRRYAWLAVRLPALLIGIFASLTIAILFGDTLLPVNPVTLFQFAALGGLLGWLFSRPRSRRGSLPQQRKGPHRQRRLYLFGRCIPLSIVIGLIVGLSWGLNLGSINELTGEVYGLDGWLRDGSSFGVVIGISSLVLSWLNPSPMSESAAATTRTARRQHFLVQLSQTIHGRRAWLVIATLEAGYVLSYGLSYVLGDVQNYGLSYVLSYGLRDELSTGLSYGLNQGLSYGLLFGIISVLVSLILEAQAEGIALTERLHWTGHSLMRSLLAPKHVRAALLVASIFGLSTGLSNGLHYGYEQSNGLSLGLVFGLSTGLSTGLLIGLLYWILLGLFQGVSSEQIEDRARRLPNQGIRHSLQNSVRMALISGGIISVIGMLSIALSYGLSSGLSVGVLGGQIGGLSMGLSLGLSYGLLVGTIVGLLGGLLGGLLVCTSRGGLAVLRHYVICQLLARSHSFPWYAPWFLEEATAHILLRRVGGGYSFPHRLLLDYFADLPQQTP